MFSQRGIPLLLALLVCAVVLGVEAAGLKRFRRTTPKTYKLVELRKFPHVDKPFTQGLEINPSNGELVETSGSFPPGTASYLRGLDPLTGDTTWKKDDGLDGSFIEGITRFGPDGHWFASVYQTPRTTVEYDANFTYLKHHPYHFEGWGLTRSVDGQHFLATNGSNVVMTLAKDTFDLIRETPVTCLGKRIPGLNELEMVDDFMGEGPRLFANVYLSRLGVVLDPSTMACTGVFDLNSLSEPYQTDEVDGYHAANGIAYNHTSKTFYMTGKNWASMFEVRLEEDSSDSAVTQLDFFLGSHSLLQFGNKFIKDLPLPRSELH